MHRAIAIGIVCVASSGCVGGVVARPPDPPRQPVVHLDDDDDGASAPVPVEAARHTEATPGCPVGIPGVRVRASDLRGGGELVFTAPPEYLPTLRARIGELARRHRESVTARARGEADAVTFADETASFHRAWVSSIDEADGVRLVAVTSRRDEVAALREELRDDAEALQRGTCPLSLAIVLG